MFIFILKLDIISLFFGVLEVKMLFLQFLFDILLLRSGSVDPDIFADPDPGSQNLADPTNPDPDTKHWTENH